MNKKYGLKADNLYIMKKSGINVPSFVCISNEQLNLYSDRKELKEYLDSKLIDELLMPLKGELYAVRSSTSLEDSSDNSFAGQFTTFLNVTKADISNKIIECYDMLYAENVLEYCKNKSVSIKYLNLNIIIQEMIEADYSGVIFTSNPQGILNESVIVVGRGSGDNVVSDKVGTTTYYYNLTDSLYYYEYNNEKIILKDTIIKQLISESTKIKDLINPYVDIEFSIKDNVIYYLQARPITTIDSSKQLILDNSNIVESYPGISLPLTDSFIKIAYTGVFRGIAYRFLKSKKIVNKHSDTFDRMVGSANGRIYYKISNWYTVLKFLPFYKKIIPIWQDMMGVNNKIYNDKKVDISFIRRFLVYINTIYEFVTIQYHMKRLSYDFNNILKLFNDNYNENLTSQQLIKLFERIKSKLLSKWDITLLNDMYAFLYTGLLKNSLKKKHHNYEELTNSYISGINNIESMKPIRELIKLTEIAIDYDMIGILPIKDNSKFSIAFWEYIEEYGDRALEELKLESDTFRTNPKSLVLKIEEYSKNIDKLKKLSKTNVEIPMFKNIFAKKAMKGISNREKSRLNRSRIYGMVRTIFLTIADRFVEDKIIENKNDIFYLTIDEIYLLINNKRTMNKEIMERKKQYETYEKLPAYSRLIFTDKEFNKMPTNINGNDVNIFEDNIIIGTPCSNGIVEGEILVIESIKNIKDVKDKILVTKMTDPGWVFLLATAKGIISEKGSLLSHTAIISRELGIPSIVGVENACLKLKNKKYLKMDGNSGKIEVLE